MNPNNQQQQIDLLITNGYVITVDDTNRIIENGAVAVCGDRIAGIGSKDSFLDKAVSGTIDARGGIIMPGLINAHTHASMTCLRGIADDLPLMTWLNDHIFPAESKLDADKVYKGAVLACAEMIMSGTTCFCDMYLFEDAVACAAKDCRMRAVVGEVLYDFPSPNYGSIDRGFDYTRDLIAKWKHDPLITVAVEPHSPYLCAPELLKTAFTIAQSQNAPLVIHLSETRNEVSRIQKKYGMTPVAHLADIGVLAPNLLACHCVALTDADIHLLKKHDVKVAHNPESNMKLASGIAPVPKLQAEGVCVAIGTDGCCSNNNLDMFLEMDTAAKLHKVNTLDPTVMKANDVIRMCTIEAARALGMDHVVGSLEIGKLADIIVIDINKPHLTPMYHPASHLVYSVRGSDVAATIINGQPVMEDRRLLSIDAEKAMADVNRIAKEIKPGGF